MIRSHCSMRMPLNYTDPLARILGFIVGLLVLIAAVIVGGFVLAAFIGLAVFAGLLISVRLWWFRRKVREAMERGDLPPGQGDRIIETEYHVIEITEEDSGSDSDARDARKP